MQHACSLDLFWTHHWCRTWNHWAWTPSYPLWRTKYPASVSSRTTSNPVLPAAVVSRSGLHVFVTKSSPLRRGSPTWVDQTHVSCLLDLWTHGSPGYIRPTQMKIRPHITSNHSPSKSFTMPRPSTHLVHRDDLDHLLLLVVSR